MWPLSAIIGVAVAGAVILFATGGLLACAVERRRHRHLLKTHGLTRGLSTYHRPKLSANEQNYAHITLPTTDLRRSVRLLQAFETYCDNDNALEDASGRENYIGPPEVRDVYTEVLRPQGRRNIRRSFQGHSLNIPKTRRLNKIRKVMPPEQMHNSPLSAITENTDSPPCISPAVAEFSAETSTIFIPETALTKREKYTSTQWPLVGSNTLHIDAIPTEVMSIAARASVLMRMGGGQPNLPATSRSAVVPRSASAASMASEAPDDPLPPLPLVDVYKHPRTNDARTRTSNASLESIGSSVLGTIISSPSHAGTELGISNPNGLDFDVKRTLLAPKLKVPPGRQAIHGLCSGIASIRSLHPSVDMNNFSPEPTEDASSPRPPLNNMVRGNSFKIIDASNWEPILPLKIKKTRIHDAQHNRHSMYEPSSTLPLRSASDFATASFNNEPISSFGQSLKRPASVATGNPLQWDRQGNFSTKRHSLSSLDGQKRGHKRQNCVRITNLPFLEQRASKVIQLPELKEEHYNLNLTNGSSTRQETQGEFEVKQPQPQPTLKTRSSLRGITSTSTQTPSPFKNCPILTPSSRPFLQEYIQQHPSSVSSGTPRPDSEIFDTTHLSRPLASGYDSPPCQWPLSPTPRTNIRLNATPPSAGQSENRPFESPILPSPALKSSSLYPRRSLVKGPRNPRSSDQMYRMTCPSPLHNKHGASFRVSKDRESPLGEGDGQGELGLRKSVMMLRSMNSEGRLLDHHSSRIYRNVGYVEDGSAPSETQNTRLLTPPMNKRVQGLRGSSYSSRSFVGSISPSPPVLDKYGSHGHRGSGSSPLAQNMPKFPPRGAMRPLPAISSSQMTLALPTPVLISASPSAMSVGGTSIWEDASVCDESPEPENPSSHPHGQGRRHGQGHLTPLRNLNDRHHHPPSSSSSSLSYDFRVTPPSGSSGKIVTYAFNAEQQDLPGMECDSNNSNNQTSRLVQHLERAASSGRWDTGLHSTYQHAHHLHAVKHPQQRPQQQHGLDVFQQSDSHSHGREIGLGLRLGAGTSASSYA